MMIRTILLGLAVTVPSMAPLAAQSDADRAAASARVAEFNAAFEAGDYGALIEMMPPRIWTHIADLADVAPEELTEAAIDQMGAVMTGITIDGFSMDIETASSGVSDADRPWFIIPTETFLTLPDSGRARAQSDTLVLRDDGEWWLLRVDSPANIQILDDVYPDLGGLTFAPATMEPLP